jgi:hypothetical protein
MAQLVAIATLLAVVAVAPGVTVLQEVQAQMVAQLVLEYLALQRLAAQQAEVPLQQVAVALEFRVQVLPVPHLHSEVKKDHLTVMQLTEVHLVFKHGEVMEVKAAVEVQDQHILPSLAMVVPDT